MKAVILAVGLGTRLSEETDLKPKPMVEIGGKPILWHIMNSQFQERPPKGFRLAVPRSDDGAMRCVGGLPVAAICFVVANEL